MTARDTAAEKAALRARMLSLRGALDEPTRDAHATRACERVLRDARFVAAKSVCAYMSLPRELDVALVIERTWALGKQLVLPRVRGTTGELDLHLYAPADVLESSTLRVREPLASALRVGPEEVDLVLVPGLAFDAQGYRLGFGKGFYDRLLPRTSRACWIGVGFDFQLVDRVPHEAHDVPLHGFVSEARTLECTSS